MADRILACGFFVILDIRHDTGAGGWLRADAELSEDTEYLYRCLVLQIAEYFKSYDSRLILEGPNEVLNQQIGKGAYEGTVTAKEYETYNRLMQIFVDEVRRTGQSNADRYLLINPYAAMAINLQHFRLPADPARDRLLVGIHDYSCLEDGRLRSLLYLSKTRQELPGAYPIVLSEFGILQKTELSERVNFMEKNTRLCRELGIPMMLWDDGGNYTVMRADGTGWDTDSGSDRVMDAFLSALLPAS